LEDANYLLNLVFCSAQKLLVDVLAIVCLSRVMKKKDRQNYLRDTPMHAKIYCRQNG